MEYEYELRQAGEIVATGRLMHERPSQIGDRIVIGTREGIVSAVLPSIGDRPARITVELLRGSP